MNNLVELKKEELREIEGGWFGALIKEVMRSAIVGQMIDAIGQITHALFEVGGQYRRNM